MQTIVEIPRVPGVWLKQPYQENRIPIQTILAEIEKSRSQNSKILVSDLNKMKPKEPIDADDA